MVDKIVMLAEARGWDQGEFESLAGLPRGRISKWKADQGEPTARQALRMARLLDVTMEFLSDDELEQPVPAPSALLADDERALIELYRDLELDKREAVKRLATPLSTGQTWNVGQERTFSNLGPMKPAGQKPKQAPKYPDAVMGRPHHDPETGEPRDDGGKTPRRRKGG